MKFLRDHGSGIGVALILATGLPCPGARAGTSSPYVLIIEGSPAMEYIGTCTIPDSSGQLVHKKLKGTVPDKYGIDAPIASCIVQKWDANGDLEASLIETAHGLLVARAGTSAPYNWVTVQTDGPWGQAAGLRGNQGTITLPRKPPAAP
jgi:hypothetical protein